MSVAEDLQKRWPIAGVARGPVCRRPGACGRMRQSPAAAAPAAPPEVVRHPDRARDGDAHERMGGHARRLRQRRDSAAGVRLSAQARLSGRRVREARRRALRDRSAHVRRGAGADQSAGGAGPGPTHENRTGRDAGHAPRRRACHRPESARRRRGGALGRRSQPCRLPWRISRPPHSTSNSRK